MKTASDKRAERGIEKPRHKPRSNFNAGYSRISISVSPQVRAALEEMVASGLFGLTLAGVVEEMARAAVRENIVKGWAEGPSARLRQRLGLKGSGRR